MYSVQIWSDTWKRWQEVNINGQAKTIEEAQLTIDQMKDEDEESNDFYSYRVIDLSNGSVVWEDSRMPADTKEDIEVLNKMEGK